MEQRGATPGRNYEKRSVRQVFRPEKRWYHMTRSLDAARPVVGNDGWEHVDSDLMTIHDYASDGATLAAHLSAPDFLRIEDR